MGWGSRSVGKVFGSHGDVCGFPGVENMRYLVTEGCSYLVGNTNVLIYIIFDGQKMRFKHITMWIIK